MKQPDVIIVGSGPLGAICASNLAQQGLNILILEAGDIISSPPGSHLRNQDCYQQNPDSFFNEINKWCQPYHENSPPEQLPGASTTEAFGGQSLLWTNNCPRPADFECPSIFTNEKWKSLFNRAEKYFNIHDDLFDDSIRQQNIFTELDQHLQKQQRHITKTPTAAKRLSNGNIAFTATKEILDSAIEDSSHIQTQCHSKVIKLIYKDNQVTAVTVKTKDKIKQLAAPVIIIAAGAFETTQLLYHSNIRPPALGKYIHFHPIVIAQLILKKKFSPPENITDSPPRLYIAPTKTHPWHAMILRDIFPDISTEAAHPNQLIDFQLFAPIEVCAENKMILTGPTPSFDMHLSDNDKKVLDNMHKDLIDLASRLGNFRKGCEPTLLPMGMAHPMGTCRIGQDPTTSVTDNNAMVHGFKNLFLASVGLIPSSMAVNPTLTAAAIALATTDHIAQQASNTAL